VNSTTPPPLLPPLLLLPAAMTRWENVHALASMNLHDIISDLLVGIARISAVALGKVVAHA
jgi:hypothetical protein